MNWDNFCVGLSFIEDFWPTTIHGFSVGQFYEFGQWSMYWIFAQKSSDSWQIQCLVTTCVMAWKLKCKLYSSCVDGWDYRNGFRMKCFVVMFMVTWTDSCVKTVESSSHPKDLYLATKKKNTVVLWRSSHVLIVAKISQEKQTSR